MNSNPISVEDAERKKILVVDTSPWILERMSGILQSGGWSVEATSDPEEALSWCRDAPGRFGLVFIDMHFPQGNIGFEIGQRISELDGPSVVGMTATSEFLAMDGEDWGMETIIGKPLFPWLVLRLASDHAL